jgi:hypothetical protein
LNSIYNAQNGLPVFKKADIWVEIKFSQSWNDLFSSNGDINAPLVYKTPVFYNVDTSLQTPLIVNVPEKVLIKTPVFNYDFGGRGTIINLYVKDNTGTYLLLSSAWSGIGISCSGNILTRNFTLESGFINGVVELNCLYK